MIYNFLIRNIRKTRNVRKQEKQEIPEIRNFTMIAIALISDGYGWYERCIQ